MKLLLTAAFAAAMLLGACSSDTPAASTDTSGSGANLAGGPGGAGGMGGPGGMGGGGLGGAGLGGGGQATPGSQEDLVQSAGDRIFFASDQAVPDAQARATLDRQADWLQRNPQVNVWVAGNCDERGTEEYNLALGQRRANADRDYLVAHGVARTRIETISYGKSRPVDSGVGPEAWSKNRNAIMSVR